MKYKHLFTPFKIGNLEIKNRYAMAPMGCGRGHFGEIENEDVEYYVTRAKGGVGLIVTGAMLTDLEADPYMPLPSMMNINYSPMFFALGADELCYRVHSYGTKIFAQLSMGAGRNYGFKVPSPVPMSMNDDYICEEITTEGIEKKVQYMIQGAINAKNFGFDGVELHALHQGYFMDTLTMELTNKRTDKYGGSFENRMRAVIEILEGIKAACGKDFPVGVRLSMQTYVTALNKPSLYADNDAGRNLDEAIKIAQYLEAHGLDYLNVDVGLNDAYYWTKPPYYFNKGLNIEMASKVKASVNIPVLTCGRMDDPDMCENALAEGKIDAVSIARAVLADPEYVNKVKAGKLERIRPCLACSVACNNHRLLGKLTGCAVNPVAWRENRYQALPAVEKKNILVIGSGPAGMECARVAAMRGHKVTLVEKENELGGNLVPAGASSFKKEERELIQWYANELNIYGVEVKTGVCADAAYVKEANADAVVVATGSTSIMPNVKGIDSAKAVNCVDALLDKKEVGNTVVVVGGGLVGCEFALDQVMKGKKVTIVERLEKVLMAGMAVPKPTSMMLLDLLADKKVEIKTSTSLVEINENGAVVESADGKEELMADTVVLAVGFKANNALGKELQQTLSIPVYTIGDCNKPYNITNAVWEAYEVARTL